LHVHCCDNDTMYYGALWNNVNRMLLQHSVQFMRDCKTRIVRQSKAINTLYCCTCKSFL